MLIEVKVPQLSESVAEATLGAWHKQEGDAVERDENLIDIETDKVVLETPAPAAGVIVKLVKQSGDTVVAGEVIANNQDAIDAPESINADSYANWLFKLAPANAADVAALMDAAAYEAEIAQA